MGTQPKKSHLSTPSPPKSHIYLCVETIPPLDQLK
jgi:hypothetical protein